MYYYRNKNIICMSMLYKCMLYMKVGRYGNSGRQNKVWINYVRNYMNIKVLITEQHTE